MVKKSDSNQQQILNGRAALCAGRDDMSSEEEEEDESASDGHHHRFARPDNFKMCLENGDIPDAAMIHAARKRRQKAREQSKEVERGFRKVADTNGPFCPLR